MVEHVLPIRLIRSVNVYRLGMEFSAIFVTENKSSFYEDFSSCSVVEYYNILLATNMTFTTDYYISSLNSPAYLSLTNDMANYLNSAFSALPGSKSYSINFVA